MSELSNFPFKNQLSEPNLDGLVDQNAAMNCLPTCLACGTQYLTGKQYTGSEIEHAVSAYGPNYHGGTAAVEYVSYESKVGVKLYAISSSSTNYLVQQAHAHLALGHPVVCTIPSSYTAPADPYNPGESHCVVFYKDSSGVLAAMNPWQAFTQANSDSWWASRMCYGQVWIMEKGTMSGVPQGWKDNGGTLVAPNGKAVTLGFRSWVLAHDWRSDDYPLDNAYGTGPDATIQHFTYEYLDWAAKPGVQSHPYGAVYLQALSAAQAAQAQAKALQAKLDAQVVPVVSPDLKASLTSIDQTLQGVISKL